MIELARKDYEAFLDEYGFSQAFVNTWLAMPTVDDHSSKMLLTLKESPIDGVGMFALEDVKAGTKLAMARVKGARVLAGRYTNHSPVPNAIFFLTYDGDLSLIAADNIKAGEEVTINYRQAGEVNGHKK
jgi:hypothetical protein